MVTKLLCIVFLVTCARVNTTHLYDVSGATQLEVRDDFAYDVQPPEPIVFKGTSYDVIHILDDGTAIFDYAFIQGPPADRFVLTQPWIAPFGADIIENAQSAIYHQGFVSPAPEVTSASDEVNRVFPEASFTATSMLVVTWSKVRRFSEVAQTAEENTFQLVIAVDGSRTFALFLYDQINWFPAVVGISSGDSVNHYTLCDSGAYATRFLPWKSTSLCGNPSVLVFPVHENTWNSAGYTCSRVFIPIDCLHIGESTNRNNRCSNG